MNTKKKTIFIHLPSYRDPEIIPTIEDALGKAMYPDRLVFGICWQRCKEDKFDDLGPYANNKQFRIYEVDYKEAKGLAWARSIINDNLFDYEDYILQLDSHHRFVKGWDEILINMLEQCHEFSDKPILAGYLPTYYPDYEFIKKVSPESISYYKDLQYLCGTKIEDVWMQCFMCFYPHGTIFIAPRGIENWRQYTCPVPSRFLSGHFCFSTGEWAVDVKHDPDIYFSGEEINLTVRSFTRGYDMFHPHRTVIWHSTMRYERHNKLKWDDDYKLGKNWYERQESSRKKIRCLLGSDSGIEIEQPYGLGNERTISDYEEYAGVRFKTHEVQLHTLNCKFPPNPPDSEWSYSFYNRVYLTRNEFPRNDYKFIHIAYDDENGLPIYSYEYRNLDDFIKNGTTIEYEDCFSGKRVPVRFVAWANNGEWVERIERPFIFKNY